MFLPQRNEPDLDDVPEAVREQLDVRLVADVGDLVREALTPAADRVLGGLTHPDARSSPCWVAPTQSVGTQARPSEARRGRRAADSLQGSSTPRVQVRMTSASWKSFDPATLLVVDDEVALADVVGNFLEREGFAVDLAHDGPGAVDRGVGLPPT